MFELAYFSLSTDINTCEAVWENVWKQLILNGPKQVDSGIVSLGIVGPLPYRVFRKIKLMKFS